MKNRKLKGIVSLIICLCMILSTAAAFSVTASAITSGDFEYELLDDGMVEITGYTGSATKLDIPSTIDGKKVTGIGYGAFVDCTSLRSVTIPDSVIEINANAFWGCKSLTSVTIPNSVTIIYDRAFEDCKSLKSVTIPDSVTDIGDYAFGYYYDYDNEVNENIEGFHIYCYPGTAGEYYAIRYGFDYTLLEQSVNVVQPSSDLGKISKTDNADGTITLTATAACNSEFTKWNIDGDFEIVSGSLTSATVTIRPLKNGVKVNAAFDKNVNPSDVKFGDADGSGKINIFDVLTIQKHLAGQKVKINLDTADVTHDGKVNIFDTLKLCKYLAGQRVDLSTK